MRSRRSGKILVLLAVMLPSLLALTALTLDGGLLMLESRRTQHVADSAATSAAFEIGMPSSHLEATAAAIAIQNGMTAATVQAFSPPSSGEFSGRSGYVEVRVTQPYSPYFPYSLNVTTPLAVTARAVSGIEAATGPAAIVILDPDPPEIQLPLLSLAIPSVEPLLGGLEVLGLGELRVNGAILVNTIWGGVDENNQPVGESSGLQCACSCTPLLALTRVLATDLRVVGGVDDPDNYANIQSGGPHPLQANRLPVPDPYALLPVPTTTADSTNTSATLRGGVRVVGLPLLTTTTLNPGIYEWIEVVSGRVVFNPGVYVIRSVNPLTQISLNVLAGDIRAEGVMFYITNSPAYSLDSGLPDANDGETSPAGPALQTLLPSVVLNTGLLSGSWSPLNDPDSPFDGLLLYQRRQDRRPILLLQIDVLGGLNFSGNVYAKWAPVAITGRGTYRSAFACGSLRVLDVLNCTIDPLQPLPEAQDVFLVE